MRRPASSNSNYRAGWVNVTVKFRFFSSSSRAGHGERGYRRGTNYSPKREAETAIGSGFREMRTSQPGRASLSSASLSALTAENKNSAIGGVQERQM